MFKIAKGYDHVSKTIRIPEPLAKELETLAAKNDISLNRLINQCIQFALENQEEQENTEECR
ncbi:MAG: type II toxin-antitoxin system HicB family antitoxin [Oscillospiraceae bacterium]|nr:type II toxin-antitoxin system HicB family antitoxin [Oscillospiraceae bacterium]